MSRQVHSNVYTLYPAPASESGVQRGTLKAGGMRRSTPFPGRAETGPKLLDKWLGVHTHCPTLIGVPQGPSPGQQSPGYGKEELALSSQGNLGVIADPPLSNHRRRRWQLHRLESRTASSR
jgi:hypothetical protein